MADELTPEQIADLNVRRRQIRERSLLGGQQQDYLTATTSREYGRNIGDLLYQYSRMRERLPFHFAARGLINSGIYAHGLAQQVQDLYNNTNQLTSRTQDQLQGYALAKQQLQTVSTSGLSDLDELEAARKATVAAALRTAGY